METLYDSLIDRLKARADDLSRAVDEVDPAQAKKGRPIVGASPCATDDQINTAEVWIGFPLPALLRRVYTEIGNGGFGPGYGLNPLSGSGSDAANSIVAQYEMVRQAKSGPKWPEGLIPLCNWGSGIASYLDCTQPETPVIRVDPNMPKADVASRVPARLHFDFADRVKDACWVESSTFEAWLTNWADGKMLFYMAYGAPDDDEVDDDDTDDEDEDL